MKFVLLGGGIAGVTAAQRLRSLAPHASLTVVEAEPVFYYLRPGLIDLLAGRKSLEQITPFPPAWYAKQGVQYRAGHVAVDLNPSQRTVTLASGEVLPYDRLLLALGAQAVIPEVPGKENQGVFVLRTAADVERIRTYAQGARRAAVLGGGWLGIEAGRALHDLGLEVGIFERGPWLLSRQMDQPGGEVLAGILQEQGLDVQTEACCEQILGEGKVSAVQFTNGQNFPCDLVLFAAGVAPRTALPKEAGLAVNKGVVVDNHLATSAPDVFAAGDVAEWNGIVYGNISAAREQAQIAAQNMVQPGSATYQGTISVQSLKVAGVDLLCLGTTQPKGGPLREYRIQERRRYAKFVLDGEGRLQGAVLLGASELHDQVETWLREGLPVEGEVQRLVKAAG